jgi:sugar phosphate isomerase/epimerase
MRSLLCIEPAVISSFWIGGDQADLVALPKDCEFVEVYAFMKHCLPGRPNIRGSVVDYLAHVHQENRAQALAADIAAQYPGRKICAIATFMPEISASHSRKEDFENAWDALRCLVDVVRWLRANAHPVRTIELVSGSRIENIYQSGHPPRYFAHRLTEQMATARLIERLRPIADYASSGDPVFLAIELEPGPLFILSDSHSIKRFCGSIEDAKDDALSRCVGLNLDIPHWHFLAGIDPEWLLSPENAFIRNRIVHAHVCDHHVGHFCDTPPGNFNSLERYMRWFSLIYELQNVQRLDRGPEFSGFVSCEMEACRESEMLQTCFSTVKAMLSQATNTAVLSFSGTVANAKKTG